jgi:predicted DNA binding CopG/RHH family protein
MKQKRVSVAVPKELHSRIKGHVKKRGMTIQWWVSTALGTTLLDEEKPRKDN